MSIVYSLIDPLFGVSYSFQGRYIRCVLDAIGTLRCHWKLLWQYQLALVATKLLTWRQQFCAGAINTISLFINLMKFYINISMIQGWHHIFCKHIATNSASANFASHKIRLIVVKDLLTTMATNLFSHKAHCKYTVLFTPVSTGQCFSQDSRYLLS